MMGHLEKPGLRVFGIGERTPLVAEELRLEQVLGNGGTIDLDKLRLRSRAVAMEDAGHQALAGPRLAGDQDWRKSTQIPLA